MVSIATQEAAMLSRIHPDAVVFWTTTLLCLLCALAV
jgi:hypothetical protein